MKTEAQPRGLLARLIPGALLTLAAFPTYADYQSTVLGDHPLVYYRLNETAPPDTAQNRGTLGAAGNGTYVGVTHRVPGALAGHGNAAAAVDGSGARVVVPYTAGLNPPANKPFTVEAWVFPTIDGQANAQAPLFCEHRSGNRQGWVFFQRASSVGWNFRMFNQNGSAQSVDITGGPYTVNAWTHLAAVWNGSTATLYVNGVNVGSQTAGYVANSDAPFSIGAYGANNPGDNPFTGSIDEVAFYTNALSAAQIAAHYSNGTNTSPATLYSTLVASDGAIEYLRLDEALPSVDTAANNGSMGVATDGAHFPGAKHQVPGAIVGDTGTAMGYAAIDQSSTDGGVPTRFNFDPSLNTAVFSVEAWLKPAIDGVNNAQCPLYNRKEDSPRTGWVFFQRPSTTDMGNGTGWNFRMYNGVNTSRSIDITGGSGYIVGNWYHLVATFDGTVGRLYVNGAQVGSQNVVGSYAPNTDTIQFCVGGYFDGVQNPFTGSIDEVALYSNVLSPARVLAHYQNGTNGSRSTSYESVVIADKPVQYLHLDEPAKNVAANFGSLGAPVNATYVNATNDLTGPQPPSDLGFDTNNLAGDFNGANTYVELDNPAGLNLSGPITLEAWVNPSASQNFESYIIAHGGNDTFSAEDALRIEGGQYQIVSYNGANHEAAATIPPGDLGGGNWIHLAGTYDGTNWNIYRNGALLATTPDGTGALPIANANWAIGARGRWKNGGGFPLSGEDRQFTGGIDEAAIYNYALTQSQIARHFSAGQYGPAPLVITVPGGVVTLTYSAGTLQEATSVSGPYSDVLGASSPYNPPAGPSKKFYRLRF